MAKAHHHLAVFPGSFDPVTFGHLDVIARGRRLFDEVVVAVGRNPGKDELFSAQERVSLVEQLVELSATGDDDEATAAAAVIGALGLPQSEMVRLILAGQ